MSREILFRGKRLDNGGWETGSLIIIRWGCSDARHYITDKMTGYPTPIDPATVGQFTGLCDKNGKKIFEGDLFIDSGDRLMVVEVPINKPDYYALVVSDKTLGYPLIFENMSRREVIGNIHDTPELAKEESE